MTKGVIFGVGAVAIVGAIGAWLSISQEGEEVASVDSTPSEMAATTEPSASTADATTLETEQSASVSATDAAPQETLEVALAPASEEVGQATADQTDAEAEPNGATQPSFDIVRMSPDGVGVVAGRAAPGAEVELLADGEVVARAQASASGEFAIVTSKPLEEGSRTLTLASRGSDGIVARSADPVIIVAPAVPQSAPIVLRSDRENPELLQRPDVPTELDVTLDSITYGGAQLVTISGRATPGQTVRLYLDGKFVGETTTGVDGIWNLALDNGVAPGNYTLRVDEVAADGRVLSRIESPFQRATDDAIAVADGQVVVQPGNSLWRIASRVYGEGLRYTEIYQANTEQIRDPDLIYPGQIFALPDSAR